MIPFALIAVAFAALPAAWGLRAWVALAIWSGWMLAMAPVTPWQDEGPLDGLLWAFVLWAFGSATLGLILRWVWDMAVERPLHLVPQRGTVLARTDALLAGAWGLVAGQIATLSIAVWLRGTSDGLVLHLGLAAGAAGLAIAALLLSGRLRVFAGAALLTLAGLTLAGGVAYPSLILSRVEVIEPGAPRCLRTPEGTAPTPDQLRLLSLPLAQPRRPNLVLTVMTEGGQQDFRWSYRSFAFRTYGSYTGGPCPT